MATGRNLLIVVAHGLRSDALDDSNCWPLQTPNFQKLTENGIRLSAASACPADHGGMVSLLTGLHARQHGHLDQDGLNAAVACTGWPVMLSDAGYHVAGVGCVGAIEPWLDDSVLVDRVESVESHAANTSHPCGPRAWNRRSSSNVTSGSGKAPLNPTAYCSTLRMT